jgi:ubiquinone/menaquinone biosynthesis C-methylase UbiE
MTYHFVKDYNTHVSNLKQSYELDEAMSLAVGANWEKAHNVREILITAGLRDGIDVLDFGCGSGRICRTFPERVQLKSYLGTDVVQDLLDYAKTITPDYYRYQLHQELNIPAADNTFDFAFCISVFTHLKQAEIYLYMRDIGRVLRNGGTFAFSFFELADPRSHHVFQHTVNMTAGNISHPLNQLLEKNQIEYMASQTGFRIRQFIPGNFIEQSVCIMDKI